MYKKRYSVADAAAAFQNIWFHFQLHLFSTLAARKSGSGHAMGGFNPYAPSITHLPPTISLM